jgi:hypothetical protein
MQVLPVTTNYIKVHISKNSTVWLVGIGTKVGIQILGWIPQKSSHNP